MSIGQFVCTAGKMVEEAILMNRIMGAKRQQEETSPFLAEETVAEWTGEEERYNGEENVQMG